jgi:hypothetical protein
LELRARLQTQVPLFMDHVQKTYLWPMQSVLSGPLGSVGSELTSGGLRVLSCMGLALSTLPFRIGDPIIKARCLIETGVFEACAISVRSKGAPVVSWLVHAAEAALCEDGAADGLSEWERLVLQCFVSFSTCLLCITLDECLVAFDPAHGAATAAAKRGLNPDKARAAGLRACTIILDMAAAILAVRHVSGRSDLLLQHGPLSSSVQLRPLYQSMLEPGEGGELRNILVRGWSCTLSWCPVCRKGLC